MNAVAPERVYIAAISSSTAFNWLGDSCRSRATIRFMFGLRISTYWIIRRTCAMTSSIRCAKLTM